MLDELLKGLADSLTAFEITICHIAKDSDPELVRQVKVRHTSDKRQLWQAVL